MKKILLNVLRIVISVGLLTYLLYLADFQKVVVTIQRVNILYLSFSIGVFFICVLIFTRRWQVLLSHSDIKPGYRPLLAFYFIGYFFNNFLPTTVGGDVSRVYNVARISGKKAPSVGIVLLERIMGVMATLTYATLSMFWVSQIFSTSRIIFLTVGLFLVTLTGLLSLFNQKVYQFNISIIGRLKFMGVGEKIARVLHSIHEFRDAKRIMLNAYGLSLLAQLLLIFINYILALSLGITQVSLGYFFLVVPVTFVMGLLPSINGLGVRDSGYVILLNRVGVGTAEAISLSFLNTFVPLIISVVGGLLLIFYRHQVSTESLNKVGN